MDDDIAQVVRWVFGAGGGTIVIVAIMRIMYRLWSSDNVAIAKNKAEINIIETLQTRNAALQTATDRAYEARDKANIERDLANQRADKAIIELNKLRGQVEQLTREVNALRGIVTGSRRWDGTERRGIGAPPSSGEETEE